MAEQDLFFRAAELPSEKRSDFLEQACGSDPQLKKRILALLYEHEQDGALLDRPCAEAEDVSTMLSEELLAEEPFCDGEKIVDPFSQVGKQFGDYQLIREIARGAMGAVYRAEQTSLKRTVALKLIRTSLLTGEDEINQFHAEAEAAAQLDHPNVVPIYDVGEVSGQHFYCMKLIEGGSLEDHKNDCRANLRQSVELLVKVARGTHAAHQSGILHRDIKPGNILLDLDGNPHLSDFGLAREIEKDQSNTLDGRILGTPLYMAPEQVTSGGKPPTIAVDIYSLGAVLYRLVTGQPPFRGDNLIETLKLVSQGDPISPRDLDARIDRDLDTIILKCLEKHPGSRYHSAAALADDLEHWLNGEPVAARPVRAWEKVAKWARRNPPLAGLWCFVGFVLVGLGVAGPILAVHESRLRLKAEGATKRETEMRELAQQRSEENIQSLYFSEMNMASMIGPDGIVRLRELTDKWIPQPGEVDRRGWEWHYLNALGRHDSLTFAGHRGYVTALNWSPKGDLVASAGEEGGIRVWEATTGVEVNRLETEMKTASISWNPDGTLLAAGQADGSVLIWDPVASNPPLSHSCASSGVVAIDWNSSGELIVTGSRDKTVRVMEPKSGDLLSELKCASRIYSVAFTASGLQVVSATGNLDLIVSDTLSGQIIRKHDRSEVALRNFSTDTTGDWIAGESSDFSVIVINPLTGAIKAQHEHHFDYVASAQWSPDDKLIASASRDRTIHIWDPELDQILLTIPVLSRVGKISWGPDSEHLAFVDGKDIRICRVTDPETPNLRADRMWVRRLNWSPDGTQILSLSGDQMLRIWDPASGEEMPIHLDSNLPARLSDATWSPDGSMVASLSELIHVWDSKSGSLLRKWKNGSDGLAVDWAPRGNQLATLSSNGVVEIWSSGSGKSQTRLREPFSRNWTRGDLAWSPDGALLAVAHHRDFIEIWSTQSWESKAEIKCNASLIEKLAWSPDSKRIAASFSTGHIRVIELASESTLFTLRAHSGVAHGITWSPDGSRLASCGDDRILRVWDSETGKACLTILAHKRKIHGLAWSPDGTRIATGSHDMSIKIWDNRPPSSH